MDELWSAPAKVNYMLRVGWPRADGYHPIETVVQAIDWNDTLRFTDTDEDHLEIDGADLPDGGDNLIWQGVRALQLDARDPVRIHVTKRIPTRAGLGGGSSDAACAIAALGARYRVSRESQNRAAATVGADVSFFLDGGTARLTGVGEVVTRLDPFPGFVLVVAMPSFGLSTPDVYRTWDSLGSPVGKAVSPSRLPPTLRSLEVRNDLEPAALALEPAMGDVMAELASQWERPVLMSGSGSAMFGFFADLDEAEHAAGSDVAGLELRACSPVSNGVLPMER